MSGPAAARRVPAGLLAELMSAVRPGFRGEVFHPPVDSTVFTGDVCRVPACPTPATFPNLQLCERHYAGWKRAGRPAINEWVDAQDDLRSLRQSRPAAPCAVSGCNRAVNSNGLCQRHRHGWTTAGRPQLASWVAATGYQPPPDGETDCRFPDCRRWADGPQVRLCGQHAGAWRWWVRMRGPTTVEDWLSSPIRPGRTPQVDLRGLGRQLRLEVQYGLQRRHDEGRKRTSLRAVTTTVGWIIRAGVDSVLDWDMVQWRSFRDEVAPRDNGSTAWSFLTDTRFHLEGLLLGEDPWSGQYPNDVWDLRHVGIHLANVRYLRFAGIAQPWLRDLLKRWCRWRLSRGGTASTVSGHLRACVAFAEHLPASTEPQQLTRQRIEAWCAALTHRHPDPVTRRRYIGGLSAVLKDVHRHGWEPDLPRNAFVYDDAPPQPPSRPRWIPEPLMRQMESPPNLALFPTDDGRTVLQLLIGCGLRLKDARQLPFDCVTRDNDAAPYLAWINHKMGGRTAFFPLSTALADVVAAQQHRVRQRFPDGCRWLFPAGKANLDGSRPMPGKTWSRLLDVWLERIRLHDEHDRPIRVTAHQFRHTLGTRLINANVPQHVVQQLLDHMSPEMTAVYARLLDTTVRRHWENAVKVNAEGQPAAIPTGHPLAGATWMKLSMVRAKVTLPNGYCGAPVQTDCEYANPCLDCRFFITTADFLDQHRRQRRETVKLIDDAEHAGLARIAERNRRTLGKLDTIINVLNDASPDAIIAGGQVEDLDATG